MDKWLKAAKRQIRKVSKIELSTIHDKKVENIESILQNKKDGYCLLCRALHDDMRQRTVEEHHVMFGTADRKLSEKYGLKVYLCPEHHRTSKEAVHKDKDIDDALRRMAQRTFERMYSHDKWMEVFGKNYL